MQKLFKIPFESILPKLYGKCLLNFSFKQVKCEKPEFHVLTTRSHACPTIVNDVIIRRDWLKRSRQNKVLFPEKENALRGKSPSILIVCLRNLRT